MRKILLALAVVSIAPSTAFAQTAPAATTSAAPAAAPAHYTTANTEIGTLLDDPAAKAILEKYIPGMTTSDQIDMARGMTLKGIQQYSPDAITDAKLAAIDAEFTKLTPKK